MEVIDSMGAVGASTMTMCDYCHKPNHTEENCNAKKRAQGGFGGKEKRWKR